MTLVEFTGELDPAPAGALLPFDGQMDAGPELTAFEGKLDEDSQPGATVTPGASPSVVVRSTAVTAGGDSESAAGGDIGAELGNLRDQFFSGVDRTRAAVKNVNMGAQANQFLQAQDKLKALEDRGDGNTPEAVGLRKTIEHYARRLPAMAADATEAQADAERGVNMTTRDSVKAFNSAKTFQDAWAAFKAAPYDVVASVAAPSFATSLPAMITGLLLGPIAGGAVMGVTSGVTEAGSSLGEFARDSGVNMADAKAVEEFFTNRENLAAAMKYAGKRAGIIAPLDTLSAGIAGKTLAPAFASKLGRQAVNVPSQMVVQGATGAAGEAGAQLATKGRIDEPAQVLGEAFGELAGAPGEVVAFSAEARRAVMPQSRPDPLPSILEAPTVDAAISAADSALDAPIAGAPISAPATPDAAAPSTSIANTTELNNGGRIDSPYRDDRGAGPSWGDLPSAGSTDRDVLSNSPEPEVRGLVSGDAGSLGLGEQLSRDDRRPSSRQNVDALTRRISELEAGQDAALPAPREATSQTAAAQRQPAAPVATLNPTGTALIHGDAQSISSALRDAGITSFVRRKDGAVLVGASQGQRAVEAIGALAKQPTQVRRAAGNPELLDSTWAAPALETVSPPPPTDTATAERPLPRADRRQDPSATVNVAATSEKTAQEQGSRLLSNVMVAQAVADKQGQRSSDVLRETAPIQAAPALALTAIFQPEPGGPLTIHGKAKQLEAFLQGNGITAVVPRKDGVVVGRSQADMALELVRGYGDVIPGGKSAVLVESDSTSSPAQRRADRAAAAPSAQPGRQEAEPGSDRDRGPNSGEPRQTRDQDGVAPQRPRLTWGWRSSGNLAIKGDLDAIRKRLNALPTSAWTRAPDGVVVAVGRSQEALALLEGRATGSQAQEPLATGVTPAAAKPETISALPAKPAEVSRYIGKYGKGMGHDAARLEAARLNRKNDGVTYTAEEHGDASLENPWAVVGRKPVQRALGKPTAAAKDEGEGATAAETANAPAAPRAAAQEGNDAESSKIADIGEKIGGARKDLAEGTGRAGKKKTDDTRPTWARRFQVSEIARAGGQIGDVKDEGRWIIRDSKNTDWMGQAKQVGSTFTTKEEAEAFVPIAAVGLKHRAVPVSDGKYEIWRDITDRKRVKVVDKQFESRDDAMRYMVEHAVEIIETNTTFGEADLPLPPDRKRTGPQRRQGNVKGEDFKDTFGFRGVEFGNWNNQEERQALMNDAYDGLMDLADVLGIPPKAIGLNGDLALAFGARGHGLNSARAHYELERAVINLTKERGTGSLAHEWFHALDYYFGRQDGKASSEWVRNADGTRTLKVKDDSAAASHGFSYKSQVREELRAAYDALLKTIFKKGTTYVEDTDKADKFVAATRDELANELDRLRKELSEQKDVRYYKRNNKPASAEQLAEFDAIAKRMIAGETQALTTDWMKIEGSKAALASRWSNESLEQINGIYKAVRGRSGFDSQNRNGWMDRIADYMKRYSQRLKMLADAQAGAEKVKMVPTDFAMNAKELDQGRGGDYWTTPHEMAARAFQGFVEDKIAEQGNVSRFLNYAPANGGMLTPWGVKFPFPRGEERVAINNALQAFVDTLQTRETDSGVAMFKRGDSEAPPLRATQIQRAVDKLTLNWLKKPDIHILETMDDAPEPVREVWEAQNAEGAQGQIEGFHYKGGVYIVADQMGSGSDIIRVLYHESLGHFGLRNVFGKELDVVLRQVAAVKPKEMKAKAAQYGFDLTNERQRMSAAEELLAEMAQSRPENTLVQKAVAIIRKFLRENVPRFADMKLTDAEIIEQFIVPAREFVENGKRAAPSFMRQGDDPQALRVFHGSPHAFDRFDMDKVGTGEGNQAYGHGLYFAGAREVAEYYKNALSNLEWKTPEAAAKYSPQTLDTIKRDSIHKSIREIKALNKQYSDHAKETGERSIMADMYDALEAGDIRRSGKLYEVEIPDDGSYLLWGEPLTAQPKQVRDALTSDDVLARRLAGVHGFKNRGDFTGAEAYRALSKLEGSDKAASENLHKRGIAGIKYMDGASRNRPLRELKREFLKELPQDADFHEVTELFGTGTFSPANEAILKELQANDWLGFDYPAQAVSAALGGELANFDASPALVQAVADAQQGATFNYVVFSDSAMEIVAMFSRARVPEGQTVWNTPEPTKLDRFIYETQDGRVDLKRAQEAIREGGREIEEKFDARLAETLYPGRIAYRSQQFLKAEVGPLLEMIAVYKVKLDELSDYLLARHAPERNAHVAEVNPEMQDGGAGTNSKGDLMTNRAAKAYLALIPASRRLQLERVAAKVDAITAGTRRILVDEGLEKPEVVQAWEKAYQFYAPLFKDEAETGKPHPIGTGFNVKGPASKRSTGSSKKVVDVLAHVLMQREAAITRAEKNRVGLSLYGLVLSHPNPQFWSAIRPSMSDAEIAAELGAMGVPPEAREAMALAPTIRTVGADNRVAERPNPMYRNMRGAITLKVAGEDRVVMLNVDNERAARLADSLKNLDGLTQLDLANSFVGHTTRWLASVNTRFNVAFGFVNVIRDVQSGILNLTNTPLQDRKGKVFGSVPAAVVGIAREIRGDPKRTEWSDLFRQFQEDGGQTGYREMFGDAGERTRAIERELAALESAGKLTPGKVAHAVLDLLSDFSDALENAVRLSAYKAALDDGMSRPAAARLARELTVDFNRKGRAARELSPLYAFLNASVQGTSRVIETLRGPSGAKIIAGGVGLGVLQAVVLAAAGFDDKDIPEWVKARNLIIPTSWRSKEKRYIAIPMGLVYNALPNTGRVLAELALYGTKDIGMRLAEAVGEIAGAINPLGGGNMLTPDGALRTIAPTVLDPLIELGFNKNFAGNPIERRPFNEEGDNRPGYERARESTLRTATGQVYLGVSKAVNTLTGGTKYEAGAASPSPEQLRYLAQTVGGGALRELEKAINSSVDAAAGLPVRATAIPLAGRFVGEVDQSAVEQSKYFESKRQIERIQSSLKAAERAGDGVEYRKILKAHPEVLAHSELQATQKSIRELNKLAVETVGNPAQMKKIDAQRTEEMRTLNRLLKRMEKSEPALADWLKGDEAPKP